MYHEVKKLGKKKRTGHRSLSAPAQRRKFSVQNSDLQEMATSGGDPDTYRCAMIGIDTDNEVN